MKHSSREEQTIDRQLAWHGYAWAIGAVVFTTLVASPWRPTLEPVNIVMLYLLTVVVIAYLFGRRPAMTAAVVGVAAFDFCFVPPQFSFAVADAQYLLTFAVMLATGLLIAHLTERLRQEARQARQRERHSLDLYEMARNLSGALTDEQIVDIAKSVFLRGFGADVLVLLRGESGELMPAGHINAFVFDANVAGAVFARDPSADSQVPIVETGGMFYLPLKAPMRTRGVLVVAPADIASMASQEPRLQLETYAVLIAIALERVHFVTVARQVTVHMESERLRNTLLSALSHDLRTPLTAILGSAESMRLNAASLPAGHLALIDAVRNQARRTGELVENILDMARLESGVHLQREWQPLEEIVGAALSACAALLSSHAVAIDLPTDLPLIECDATLIERVFVNLLENAVKYTPPGSSIRITARVEKKNMRVDVIDNGPGIEAGRETVIFEKFERGNATAQVNGLGLGLAICRAIIGVHGGSICVERATSGGAGFVFTLPLGHAPEMDVDTNGEDAR